MISFNMQKVIKNIGKIFVILFTLFSLYVFTYLVFSDFFVSAFRDFTPIYHESLYVLVLWLTLLFISFFPVFFLPAKKRLDGMLDITLFQIMPSIICAYIGNFIPSSKTPFILLGIFVIIYYITGKKIIQSFQKK